MMKELIGKSIKKIEISEDALRFTTPDGEQYVYVADSDCCSQSYFYDFYGVKNILAGNPITAIESVDLGEADDSECKHQECLQIYGVRLVTTGSLPRYPDLQLEVSAVLSFRNESNGYYGGFISSATDLVYYLPADWESKLVELTDDIQEVTS